MSLIVNWNVFVKYHILIVESSPQDINFISEREFVTDNKENMAWYSPWAFWSCEIISKDDVLLLLLGVNEMIVIEPVFEPHAIVFKLIEVNA